MKNVRITNLKGAGGGGGGASSYNRLSQSNVLVTSSPFTIPSGAKNFRAELMSSGGGGGGALNISQKQTVQSMRVLHDTNIKKVASNRETVVMNSSDFLLPLNQFSGITITDFYLDIGGGSGAAGPEYACGYINSTQRSYFAPGGGGGAGARISPNNLPTSYFNQNAYLKFHDCTPYIIHNNASCQTRSIRKSSGNNSNCYSSIEILNSNKKIISGYRAYSGGNGSAGTSSGGGNGGIGSSKCQKYTSSWVNIPCNGTALNGTKSAGKAYTTRLVCNNSSITLLERQDNGGKCSPDEYLACVKGGQSHAIELRKCKSSDRENGSNCTIGQCYTWSYTYSMGVVNLVAAYIDYIKHASISAGGGGGGAKYHASIPDSYTTAGNIITLDKQVCQGGASGTNGSGGASCPTQLLIKTSGGTQTYGLQVYGGEGGVGGHNPIAPDGSNPATIKNYASYPCNYVNKVNTAGGVGSSTCRKWVSGWQNTACSANGKNGTAGKTSNVISLKKFYGTYTSGMDAGEQNYATSIHSYTELENLAGGAGGNGADNTSTGKGGNGGSTTTSGTASAGTAGSAGYARFYYDKYEAAMLSGGGGGSGASLNGVTIPQSIIDANIGGRIEIRSGGGGTGANAYNNGTKGSESYVIVKNPSGNPVWGYKALGGNGGGAASTSAGGTGGNGGTCQYASNGTNWSATSCTNGQKGGNGVKSTGTSATAGAGVGSGYGASGYGANSISTNGGNGSSGIAQITYDQHFQAAAGGGGGGGAYILVKGIKVTPLKTYNIRVGKGGGGGSAGAKGQNGGMSFVTFEGTTHYASGGEGGNPGTSQTSTGAVSHGTGGENGKITGSTSGVTFKNGGKGANGSSNGFKSIGGNGGTSGIDSKGACGGLFINASICQNTSINGQTLSFKLPRNINKAPSLGSAGAGGAGGGWHNDNYNQTGQGSKGLDGYVHIFWQTFK